MRDSLSGQADSSPIPTITVTRHQSVSKHFGPIALRGRISPIGRPTPTQYQLPLLFLSVTIAQTPIHVYSSTPPPFVQLACTCNCGIACTFMESSSQQCLQPSKIHVLILVLHGGNILDTGGGDQNSKQADVNTISTAFDTVMRVHYPAALGRIAIHLVPCPAICAEAFSLVSNYDEGCLSSSQDHIPLAALPLLATSSPQYQDAVATVIVRVNQVYADFIKSLDGATFSGQVSDETKRQLPRKRSDSSTYELDTIKQHQAFLSSLHSSVLRNDAASRRSSSSTMLDGGSLGKFDFEVSDFFLFGSPLGLVLALRKTVIPMLDVAQLRPACQQVYNLFHPADPSASRLEPLLERKFHLLPPFSVPRYQRFPLGDGNSALLVAARWWGTKRLDFALYCPDALTAFPTVALPHLFHASYWESTDVVSFLLRQ
ncbi:hypothetical protein XENOCAPTIV_030591, partial [Xenoophorus captivus]